MQELESLVERAVGQIAEAAKATSGAPAQVSEDVLWFATQVGPALLLQSCGAGTDIALSKC